MLEQGTCFSMGYTTLPGPVAVKGERFGDSYKKFSGGERKAEGRVRLHRARGSAELKRGSLWLCYAGPLDEKRKSEISGRQRRPKPIPWEENSLEN